jgi:GNAT superfamily N-acetyltransferase
MRHGRVYLLRQRGRVVATVCLTTTKPWAIDASRFSPVPTPLYLVDMAVAPELQRRGIGRRCLVEVARLARLWPAGAIRLDAYDGPAGAGPFYQRCGYREVGRAVYRNVPLVYYENVLS